MAATTTAVGIANKALIKLGQDKIDALTDTNNRAVAANEFYDQARQEVLIMTRPGWNCAKKRARLAYDNSQPVFDYDYKYRIPKDCLRVLYPTDSLGNPTRGSWERRGEYILSNQSNCYLFYIQDLEDVKEMSPLLISAIVLQLATHICYRIKQSITLKNSIEKDLATILLLAEGAEASEKHAGDPSMVRKTGKVMWVDEK